jgi:YaiO family outer membrane protein
MLASLLLAGAAHAQVQQDTAQPASQALQPAGTQPGATATPGPIRGFETYISRHNLTGGFPDWREFGVRGSYQAGPHLLQGELATMKRWNESGVYGAIGDTYTFNEDWFGSLSLGAGDGASYLPRYRVDAFINRKLLEKKNLVGTLGAGYYRAPDGHIDRNVSVGATYYFDFPLVVQGEVKFTHGSPGSVDTRQHFVAGTWGRDKQSTFTARYGWGEEGYQAIGGGATLTNFRSKELSLNLRHWLGKDWGVEAALEHYRNPFYRRNGATAGLFWQIP